MSIEVWHELKALKARIAEIEKREPQEHACPLVERLEKLEAQYKMMNARISRKNNGEILRQ